MTLSARTERLYGRLHRHLKIQSREVEKSIGKLALPLGNKQTNKKWTTLSQNWGAQLYYPGKILFGLFTKEIMLLGMLSTCGSLSFVSPSRPVDKTATPSQDKWKKTKNKNKTQKFPNLLSQCRETLKWLWLWVSNFLCTAASRKEDKGQKSSVLVELALASIAHLCWTVPPLITQIYWGLAAENLLLAIELRLTCRVSFNVGKHSVPLAWHWEPFLTCCIVAPSSVFTCCICQSPRLSSLLGPHILLSDYSIAPNVAGSRFMHAHWKWCALHIIPKTSSTQLLKNPDVD